jgi:hypothetical protein
MAAALRQEQSGSGAQDIPAGACVKTTGLAGVLSGAFSKRVSVFLHRRTLRGDFNTVATKFSIREAGEKYTGGGFFSLTEADVRDWSRDFTGEEKRAADTMLSDMARLRRAGISPLLRIVAVPDEVDNGFHTDPTGNAYGRILCCYNGLVTQGLSAEDAVPMGDEYLPRSGARIFAFAPGDIWRHAPRGFESSFAPFIHAAPKAPDGEAPRMLLVGDIMPAAPHGLWQKAKAGLGLG